MNEFIAKKLGEVLAFERLEVDTLERGKDALKKAYGEESLDKMIGQASLLRDQLEALTKSSGDFGDVILSKAEATGKKLSGMRDLYLSEDDWEDVVEIMEWSGAFEGGAIVHWSLVKGALGDQDMEIEAEEAMAFHVFMLEQITITIQRAQEL